MSTADVDPTPQPVVPASSTRGQSMVEFALVLPMLLVLLPMLLVLLLGIADFARVFSAGIVLEAATRNAAEIGAIERLRQEPPSAGDPAYYAELHLRAAEAACDESRRLPTFDAPDACPAGSTDSDGNASWFVRVCVHDGSDPACDAAPSGYSSSPPANARCPRFLAPMTNSVAQAINSYYVEVRTCYKFETLFHLNLSLPMNAGLAIGDSWLERSRIFVVDCPVGSDPSDLAANCPNP